MSGARRSEQGWGLLCPAGRQVRVVQVGSGGLVGAAAAAHVRIGGRGVRQRHARLTAGGDGLWIAPEGRAEVVIGGREVRASGAPLRSGEAVRLGGVTVVPVRVEKRRGRRGVRAGGLTSSSPAMWRAIYGLSLSAAQPWPVLLQGESGTGKEVAARLVHDASPRRERPFVAINCAALPAGLLAAELFGNTRGAFTGAVADRPGAFVRADGGTLMLDELGELSPAGQAALLRVLESGEVQVVGGATRRVDVRLVAATNVDLAAAAARGDFRLDLLHRLAVTPVHLPPLRERGADAAVLAEDFLAAALSRRAARVVAAHTWPGNIRELRNVARRVRVHHPAGPPPAAALQAAIHPGRRAAAITPRSPASRTRLVATALRDTPSVAAAWRRTGLPRSTFFRYLARVRAAESALRAPQPAF